MPVPTTVAPSTAMRAAVVTVDVIEVGVERFVHGSPALCDAVEDKRPECVLHGGVKVLYPNVVPCGHPQSITAVSLSVQPVWRPVPADRSTFEDFGGSVRRTERQSDR